ncbi:MAG: hypothetical protein FWG62_09970 [Proteobacteria bacterium]|nr:hypothetical protein [Pseudomonadota bacterium]
MENLIDSGTGPWGMPAGWGPGWKKKAPLPCKGERTAKGRVIRLWDSSHLILHEIENQYPSQQNLSFSSFFFMVSRASDLDLWLHVNATARFIANCTMKGINSAQGRKTGTQWSERFDQYKKIPLAMVKTTLQGF